MKPKKELSATDNPTVYKKLARRWLKCPICPPNKGENSKRKAKRGTKKPKYKNRKKD